MMAQRPRLCPSCRSVLAVRRWRISGALCGEVRTCLKRETCGYTAYWQQDDDAGMISGTITMRLDKQKQGLQMVPGAVA